MASFGGLSFNLYLKPGDEWVSLFPSKKNYARVPIPFSMVGGSSQLVQLLSVENPRETFTVLATNDSVAPALEHVWQVQQVGTLDLTFEFGAGISFDNVVLVDIPSKRRRPYSTDWLIECTFEQVL